MSVQDMHQAFNKCTAYTTLMTTLDRLYRKKLLSRRKDGRAFIYSPRVSRAEFEQGIREGMVNGLLGQHLEAVEPVMSYIIDKVIKQDHALFYELELLVKKKKRVEAQ